MTHKPIRLIDLSLSFPHKTCFTGFNVTAPYGSRIAIIGRNGSGKSTLLKMLQGLRDVDGTIIMPPEYRIGHVPQIVDEFETSSGGERFNKSLTQALSNNPSLLLLDEPTNHLDRSNRKSLLRLLRAYTGTLIVASHDIELIRNVTCQLWHIDQNKVRVFSGNIDDLYSEIRAKRSAIERKLSSLKQEKKDLHHRLMKEQERAKKSDLRGQKSIREHKWPTIVSDEKARRAIETTGKKKRAIRSTRDELLRQLSELRLPEVIVPRFSIDAECVRDQTVVSVDNGSIGYSDCMPLLRDINIQLNGRDRIAIYGDNGSGKSTLIKGIMTSPHMIRSGTWHVISDVGYLDQHYNTLSPHKSVFETIAELAPTWSETQIRCYLNDFLFRKNQEVYVNTDNLSGGERVRLSLALIGLKTPRLLILDEVTNNIDFETREHVIQVLKAYPGALIVISHDEDFLQQINVCHGYKVDGSMLHHQSSDIRVQK